MILLPQFLLLLLLEQRPAYWNYKNVYGRPFLWHDCNLFLLFQCDWVFEFFFCRLIIIRMKCVNDLNLWICTSWNGMFVYLGPKWNEQQNKKRYSLDIQKKSFFTLQTKCIKMECKLQFYTWKCYYLWKCFTMQYGLRLITN